MLVSVSTNYANTLNRQRRYRLRGSNYRHKWKILKMQDTEARRMEARDARVMEQVKRERSSQNRRSLDSGSSGFVVGTRDANRQALLLALRLAAAEPQLARTGRRQVDNPPANKGIAVIDPY